MKKNLLACGVLAAGLLGWWGYGELQSPATSKDLSAKTPIELHKERIASKKLKREERIKADHPEMYAAIHREIRTREGEAGPRYAAGQVMSELSKARQLQQKFASRTGYKKDNVLDFIERGPGNVAGRTRSIVVLPGDPDQNTWLAGSVGGGVWKTTDAGQTWVHLTEGLPNLATTTVAICEAQPEIIYVGTGESFAGDGINGSGMYKSTDAGATWTLLSSTTSLVEFQNINRIIVDPSDPDYVVACGRQSNFGGTFVSGIYYSTDGGATWTQAFDSPGTVQQVLADPNDFNTQYATVFGTGVWKSTDAGQTWTESSAGLTASGRIEIAVAPSNSNYIYASAQGNLSGSGGSDMFVSQDAGATWRLLLESADGTNIDHLGGQGGYDNCVVVNPYNENVSYAGGVNLFKFTLNDETIDGQSAVTSVDEEGTEAFLDFINFGGGFFGGALDVGSAFAANPINVEIRFGAGETQKAHRFTVGNNGSGVPATGYFYEDYVDVPFTVWDIDNDRQLMVSFRDQQQDGVWNLIGSNTDGDPSTHAREYLYIQNVTYSETADANIAQDGSATTGHEYEQVYFFWPVLADGGTFDAAALPTSTLRVNTAVIDGIGRTSEVVSDAYGDFTNVNSFSDAEFINRVGGIHPDHHFLLTINEDDAAQSFRLVSVNDGGVYYTNPSDDPGVADGDFNYAGFGYNTSQFYGADKRPGVDQYIGGMQDNSTWHTPLDEQSTATTQYEFAFGGDGFEAVWNKADPNKMIGSIQFNAFRRSLDGGETWTTATSGLTNTGGGSGAPFISRLSNHPDNPDRLYALGADGVWISQNFGESWELTALNENYSLRGDNEVKISIADPNIVWTGGAMVEGSQIHVSTDAGATFTAVPNYDAVTLGSITGIATHPTEPNTAYVLFSFAEGPKVLRTTDLGQTWEDISGYGVGSESTNGFPDVATYSLFVFPWNTDRIWAGTEIGIFESLDNGQTWALLDCNMPATAVWQMQLVDDQVVIATHGRGIWSVSFPDAVSLPPTILSSYTSLVSDIIIEVVNPESYDSMEVYLDGDYIGVLTGITTGDLNITIGYNGADGELTLQTIGYLGATGFPSNEFVLDYIAYGEVINSYGSNFDDSPAADFITTDFIFDQPTGFLDPALHSPHDYETGSNIVALLKNPIKVGAGVNTTFTYEDVTIVEPGLDGSAFGESAFFDYVVVEATKDGKTWTPLEDGYDANADAGWLDKWNRGGDGTRFQFVEHIIDLLDTFDEGDTIAVRFRLFSDAGSEGWGWAIDDFYAQEEKPEEVVGLGAEIANNQLGIEVFPVPAGNGVTPTVRYYLPEAGNSNIRVMTLGGQLVEDIRPGYQPSGEYELALEGRLEAGIYLVQIQQGETVKNKKMIIH